MSNITEKLADRTDEREDYEVVIEGVVRKTIKVKANSEDEATELAHELFTVAPENLMPEDYNEQTISCKKA